MGGATTKGGEEAVEKVISEWRIVETDDGFRLEVKGDKAVIREWLEHFTARRAWRMDKQMPFGPWAGRHWHGGFWGPCGPEPESKEEHQA